LTQNDPKHVFIDLDGHGLAGMGLAHGDALVDDISRALTRRGPLAGREGEGNRAPQLAVANDLSGVLVEADGYPLADHGHAGKELHTGDHSHAGST
jgi:hypothetical protein